MSQDFHGNFQIYSGLMPQLFKIIASNLNCSWNLIPSVDGMYGTKNADGSWNGLIGMLERGEVDLALADLSVTSDRSKVNRASRYSNILCL